VDATRRRLLQAAAGAVTLAQLPRAFARMPLLTEQDADAIALGYLEDATRIDPAVQTALTPGSRCQVCYFFQGGVSSETAPCTVFAGFRVRSTGWCREFTPRA
jgi:hypothetical protein